MADLLQSKCQDKDEALSHVLTPSQLLADFDPLAGLQIKDEHLRQVFLGNEYLVQDGAMGTMLQKAGLATPGVVPDLLNFSHPEEITAIHKQYVDAGAEMVITNTFGANRYKLEGQASVAEVFQAAADNVRAAGARYV
ncbi:MAG: homocysteine S-methyltransferase family protein, partial [Anaerotardibacter sp.]